MSNTTYVVDHPCPREWNGERFTDPCEIAQVFDYDVPTPHLMCYPHGAVVGRIVEAA